MSDDRSARARLGGRASLPRILSVGGGVALLLLVLPGLLPTAPADVALRFPGTVSTSGAPTDLPFTSGTSTARTGMCTATATGTVAVGSANARASVAIVEPRTCNTGTRLVFLPMLTIANGLSATAGHTLTVHLTILSGSGTGPMLRRVQLYVQQVGNGNAHLTTSALVIRGGIVTATTSNGTVVAGTTYGLGITMTLTQQATVSTAGLVLEFVAVLDDAGVVRSVVQQQVAVSFQY